MLQKRKKWRNFKIMKEYLTIRETANLVGVSPQTLRNWEKCGELVPYRNPINNYRMYKVIQIENFIEDMRNERSRNGKFKLKVKIVQA